ncbi:MAG: hypothetical protein ACFE9D_10765 [Promethearchaeota archaeon]
MNKRKREDPDVFGIVTFGFILILLAGLLVAIPTLLPSIINFLLDMVFTQVTPGIWWWTPTTPAAHAIVYNAMYLFFLGTIIINIIVLVLRVVFRDSYRRQIESIGGIISSAGITWAAYMYSLNYLPVTAFVTFCGWLIVFLGINMIVTSIGHWLISTYM